MSGPVPGGAHVGDRLSAYLDGELPEMERAQVEAHVRDCVPCSQWLSELQAVDDCAQEIAMEAPEGYFDAFPGRVRARLAARRRPRVPLWTWAAAAAVLLAVITPLTLRESREPASVALPAPASTLPQARLENTPAGAGSPTSSPLMENVQTRSTAAPAAPTASSADGLADKLRAQQPAPRTQDEARLQERDAVPSLGYVERGREEQQAEAKKEAATAARADSDRRAEGFARQVPPPQDAPAVGPKRAAVPLQAQPPPPAPAPSPTVPATLAAAASAKPAEGAAVGGTPGGLVGGLDDTRAEPEAKGDTELGLRRRKAAGAGEDVTTTTGASGAAAFEKRAQATSKDFDALARRTAASAEQSRALYRDWTTFAARHRGTAEGDEARVRALEALAAAWRLERRPADRTLARALGEAYVKEPGPQKARVRALLDELSR